VLFALAARRLLEEVSQRTAKAGEQFIAGQFFVFK
jgi:hypothetical protein